MDTSGYEKVNVKNIPNQMNGSDCGMFACKFAEYISRNADITFTQVTFLAPDGSSLLLYTVQKCLLLFCDDIVSKVKSTFVFLKY